MNMFKNLRMKPTDERGVSTVIVVVSLVGILGAALLSLDFGSMWASRRQIITATDSTVLRQASLAALGEAACNPDPLSSDYYVNWLYKNASTIVPNSWDCDVVPDTAHPGTGYVVVEARKYADTRFGGLFGFAGDTEPYSLTAAEYGFVNPTGLRPMAFCLQNAHVMQWIWYQNWLRANDGDSSTVPDPNFGQLDETTYNNQKGDLDAGAPPVVHNPTQTGDSILFSGTDALSRVDFPQGSAVSGSGGTSYASFGVVHRMFFTKDDVNETGNCGAEAPGNWGWLDFDGNGDPYNDGGGSAEQNDWVENGYDGGSAANDCNADGTTGDECDGDPGSSGGAASSELQSLIDSQTVFFIPIFSNVCCVGGTAQFTMWGFLPLTLRGFRNTGPENARYFDFEFVDAIASAAGDVTETGGLGTPKGIKICAVDHDGDTSAATIAARCD
jgi:hypothetical protein